ncbi:MAG: preprotein translocase subunit SecD [Roseibaca calidilacus]|uniref:Protein translocase subunit SecD n=1 Tax=Roseibaca calidilacus TaxID=1666912 RepID=A0A0P7WPK5_9RHOB|nr:protein translocase subunit SecD [Roseibaca calidilacus]KPP95926.1 MAG: preprotein translocase subunit SecD [Roseibaca calidilacus]CUX81480.1 preprotein translocase subunit SecD [Roseibaca calidilacus]
MLHIPMWKRILIWGTCALALLIATPNLFYNQVERYNDAVSAQERGEEVSEDDLAAWPGFLPSFLLNLGLDLRGGAHLLAEVQVSDVYADRVDALWPTVRDQLREARDTVGAVRRMPSDDAGELRVRIGRPEAITEAAALVRDLAQPTQSVTGLGGGDDLDVRTEGEEIVVALSAAERQATDERTMRTSLEIIRRRVDEAGTREPTIQRQGEDRILIQVPGIGSAEELKALIGTTARLTFHPVVDVTSDPDQVPDPRNALYPAMEDTGTYYEVEQTPVVTGDQLVDASAAMDQNNRPAVNFRFNAQGGRAFGLYTAENIGSPFAIVLDGEVVSAPTIQSHIPGGSGIITGRFTVEETTQLAVLLRSGALPAEMEFLEERTVGPELGQDSIDAGRIAAMVAMGAVLVFMIASYGVFGVFANIALLLNVAMIFALLSLVGATLTLPGIAGIVLTIGMAVDANVLVFERIREELRTAKGPARAIALGYEKALSAILDANITTFLTAVILFVMGSGPVRGFAVTLGLGIMTSVFTALLVTRVMVVMYYERRRPKTLAI